MTGGSLRTVCTEDQLKAGFPTIILTINGKIILRELIRIWKHCKCCTQHTETNCDARNYLFTVLPPALWPYLLTRSYPAAPPNPGKNPSYNKAERSTVNMTIRDVWQLAHKYHEEHNHMNSVLVNRFLKRIPDAN